MNTSYHPMLWDIDPITGQRWWLVWIKQAFGMRQSVRRWWLRLRQWIWCDIPSTHLSGPINDPVVVHYGCLGGFSVSNGKNPVDSCPVCIKDRKAIQNENYID